MAGTDHISAYVSPGHRFMWGIALLITFLFSQDIIARALFVLLFALLAAAAGKRIKYGYFVILTLSITLFNLLTPWGRVLVSVWGLDITGGALRAGLTKGLTISGLVFVSLFSVSPRLTFPGRFGRLLGRSLYYFERLYSQKHKVSGRRFFSDIDEILLSLFPAQATDEATVTDSRTRPGGALLIFLSLGIGIIIAGSL